MDGVSLRGVDNLTGEQERYAPCSDELKPKSTKFSDWRHRECLRLYAGRLLGGLHVGCGGDGVVVTALPSGGPY